VWLTIIFDKWDSGRPRQILSYMDGAITWTDGRMQQAVGHWFCPGVTQQTFQIFVTLSQVQCCLIGVFSESTQNYAPLL